MAMQRELTVRREATPLTREAHLDLHRRAEEFPIEGALLSTEEVAESPTTQRWRQLRCYGFSVGPCRLLVSQATYCELLIRPPLAFLPNAPQHLLGLTNVRGNLVPVYQLEPLLNLEGRDPSYALIIGNPTTAAALAIDHKPTQLDLASLETSEIPADLPDFLRLVVTAAHAESGNVWCTFDHEQLFLTLASG